MASEVFTVYSTHYIDSKDIHTGVISLEEWTRLSDILESPRLFANIEFNSKTIMCALNCVSIPREFPKSLFLPEWMIPHGVDCGSQYTVNIFGVDALPKAEHVVLRPLDSAFYNTDAKEELEANLTKLGCLTKGQIVVLPLNSLGGYELPFYVVDLLPADCVLLDGDEVSCEFEEAVDQFDGRPPTPIPDLVPSLESMIPTEEMKQEEGTPRFQGTGHSLGGGNKRMADGRPWNPYR